MATHPGPSSGSPPGVMALLTIVCAMLSGCVLTDVKRQTEAIDNAGRLDGRVLLLDGVREGVVVAALRKTGQGSLSLHRVTFAGTDGGFTFMVPPGEYYVVAFEDKNGDARYQPEEPGSFYGDPSAVMVRSHEKVRVEMQLTAASLPQAPADFDIDQAPEIGLNTGRVTTLDDVRFDPANGELGLWRPMDFLKGTPQGGLFLLGDYDSHRMPVIFVHGMGGGPRDWSAAISGLDLRLFQPWVLFYPSGVRLGMVSDYFVAVLHELQRQYGFKRFAVVAHSMGGLVARSFGQKYWGQDPDAAQALCLVITVNSPMAGMDSAATGVQYSPIVVPVWQDVATGSRFVTDLAARGWPSGIPYHLIFSYAGNSNGDGTVPLSSQIPLALQAEATRIYGLEDDHVGTLSNRSFLELLYSPLKAASAASS